MAFFHANTNADIITPTITAIARSCQTVMAETVIRTMASEIGIFLIILKLLHANVPITTMNITPTSAAIGIFSISGAPKSTKHSKAIAAISPDNLPLPPELTLIID